MARRGIGIAFAVGAAIALGGALAFASSKNKEDDEDDTDDTDDTDGGAPEVSPVVPTGGVTPLGTPPFVPPDLIPTTTAPKGSPPINPPVVAPPVSPGTPPPVVELPDEDETEAETPTVKLPGGVDIALPPAGSSVTLPGGVQVQVPTVPGITAPATEMPAQVPAPPVPAVEKPSLVPQDTAALAALMLADEATANWKRTYPELGAWQAARGLTVDQKFGPGSALRMAQEIGTVPIVRFWPKGTTRETALEPYRNSLLALAGKSPEPRRAQLIMSANREQGQSFSSPSSPIKTLVTLGVAA